MMDFIDRLRALTRRYVVTEVQWYGWGREPIAWAVRDLHDDCYIGDIWYSSKQSARNAAKIFNGEDAP